jgi:hypothetical protein
MGLLGRPRLGWLVLTKDTKAAAAAAASGMATIAAVGK